MEWPSDPVLLAVDGHKSRFDAPAIAVAHKHNVTVFCLPSHTTHLLQPNGSGFNKSFKTKIGKSLSGKVANGALLDCPTIAQHCVTALRSHNILRTIRNSFEHCGIYRLDRSKMSKMIESERPRQPAFNPNDQAILDRIRATAADIQAAQAASKERRKKPVTGRRFSTAKAQILTSADSISLITISSLMAIANSIKQVLNCGPIWCNFAIFTLIFRTRKNPSLSG